MTKTRAALTAAILCLALPAVAQAAPHRHHARHHVHKARTVDTVGAAIERIDTELAEYEATPFYRAVLAEIEAEQAAES